MNKKKLISKLNFEDVLLDSLPNPVYYKDTKGKFIRTNSCFSKLMKTKKENIIGKLAYEFFPEKVANRHKLIDKQIMQTLGTQIDEIYLPMEDGSIRYFTLNKAVYLNQDGSVGGIVCVMDDITERLKSKEILIQQNKFAEMGEMITAVAHQWKEPLVELSGQIQKLEYYYFNKEINEDKMAHFVNDSMIQIKYMSETLNDFRSFLKSSNTKKHFGIKKAIKEIFDIVGRQIFYLNIEVNFNYKHDEEIYIYGYENKIKQVILNIINNAKNKLRKVKRKKKFKARISINLKNSKKYNIIQIIDNGGEIDENIKKHVFEPFFTTKAKGMGFGLYMAKVIIEDKLEGKIKVKNFNGNVIFSIKIPRKEKNENFIIGR